MILTQTHVPLYHDPAIHYSITFPSSLQTLVFSRNFPLLVKVSKKKVLAAPMMTLFVYLIEL